MTPQEFLERIVPPGNIVIAKLAENGFRHYVFTAFEPAAKYAIELDVTEQECYFGLGSLVHPKVWNAGKEKWEIRVGRNIAALKCLFADIDIADDDPKKYTSQGEALEALDTFCETTDFPSPLVVSSGAGLHCYWPFTTPVGADAWRPVAAAFKTVLRGYGLKIDPSRTADASSVLRVAGTTNYKYTEPLEVKVIRDVPSLPPRIFFNAVQQLVGRTIFPISNLNGSASTGNSTNGLGSNLEKNYDPSWFAKIPEQCPQMQALVDTGGDSEPIWYAGLQITRLVEDAEEASLAISKMYPGFNAVEMHKKIQQLTDKNIGPTLCARFDEMKPGICQGCRHYQKITSPIQIGRVFSSAPAPVVEVTDEITGVTVEVTLPTPPFPYARKIDGSIVINIGKEQDDMAEQILVHEYDMYPVRRMVNERSETEQTIWRVNQPIQGWMDVQVEQATLAAPERLHGLLLSKGVYIAPIRIKLMVAFMVAYIKKLQQESLTEHLYAKLGWRQNNTVFVLDDKIYHNDGKVQIHNGATTLHSEVRGLKSAGTLQGWKDCIQFYNAPGHEAHRFMLYGAFGSPLFHMTGHHGVIVNASGKPGAGKTTVLEAVASVWGHPHDFVLNGTKSGTTQNALFSLLSAYNNLPVCFDEITRLEQKLFSDVVLAIPQGQGKRRNTRAGTLSSLFESWALMMFTTANTDAYATLGQTSRDATAELMRVLQVPFLPPTHYSKEQADQFAKVSLYENYGLAGHVFAAYCTCHYKEIKDLVQQSVKIIDKMGSVSSAERFWSAAIGASCAGAIVARRLGLILDFPIQSDIEWIVGNISEIRSSMQDHVASPREVLSEYLDSYAAETLVVSQTGRANIGPRIDKLPHGSLVIRHEIDTHTLWITKSEFRKHCIETGANFAEIQDTLQGLGVLVDKNSQKVLGSGTDLGKGQVRCWQIDVKALNA